MSVPIVPTANPGTYTSFGKRVGQQFSKTFKVEQSKALYSGISAQGKELHKELAARGKEFSTQGKQLHKELAAGVKEETKALGLTDKRGMAQRARARETLKLTNASKDANEKLALANARAERAPAYSTKKLHDEIKAKERVDFLQGSTRDKKGFETSNGSPKQILHAQSKHELAKKDYLLSVQQEKQAVSTAKKAEEAAKKADRAVARNVEANKLSTRFARSATQQTAKLGQATQRLAAQRFRDSARETGNFALRQSQRGLRAAGNRLNPFRGVGSGGMRTAGRRDGGHYANSFGAATRNIKTKLLTGMLPNRANMAGLIRGSMMNAASEGAHAGNVFTRAFAGTMGLIGTSLTASIVGVGLAAATVLGSGINRALSIEDGEARLSGLNYTGEQVKSIMSDVEKSVIGTKFSLDQALMIGSSALAAGIKPGEELTQYLMTTADAATIAGVNMDQMGRIMNKITANDKLMAQEGNQLADKALPIWSWLAESRGVTVRELRKLVKAGKVSSEETMQVIQKNIGGVALKSADTTRGAFANMRIAYARFGAIVANGALPIFKQLFAEHIKLADFMSKKFGPQITDFWAKWSPKATQEVADWGATIQKFLSGGYNNNSYLIDIKNIMTALKDLGLAILKLKPIAAVWDVIKSAFKNDDGTTKTFEKFVDDIRTGNEGITKSMMDLYGWLMKATTNPDNFVNKMWENLVGIFEALKPAMKDLMPILGNLAILVANGLGNVLIELMPALVKALPEIGKALVDGMEKVGPVIADLLPKLPGLIIELAGGAASFMKDFVPFLEKFLPELLDFIGQLGALLIDILPPLVAFLTSNDGFWIKALLVGIIAYYGFFVLIAGIAVTLAMTIVGIIGSIVLMIMDVMELFKTGKWGNNLNVVLDGFFGTELAKTNPGGGEGMANALGMHSDDRIKQLEQEEYARRAALSGSLNDNKSPYTVNNTINQTNNVSSDVDAARLVEMQQQYFQNQPQGTSYGKR